MSRMREQELCEPQCLQPLPGTEAKRSRSENPWVSSWVEAGRAARPRGALRRSAERDSHERPGRVLMFLPHNPPQLGVYDSRRSELKKTYLNPLPPQGSGYRHASNVREA